MQTAMQTEDQSAQIAFMLNPAHWPDGTTHVEHVETHISHVFLGRRLAYKMKKAVRLPYLDFSTLERRRRFCRRELEINARFSPRLYLGLDAITRESDGTLALSGQGEPVEWLVRMRRFDTADILANHVRAHGMDDALIRALARTVVESHRIAQPRLVPSGAAILATTIDDQLNPSFSAHTDVLTDKGETLLARLNDLLKRHAARLNARARSGWVRRCHGDLHLGNIVLIDGRPQLFDAIEFDEALATVDVLHDLAFLLMDLVHGSERDAANRLMNTWLALMDDPAHHEAMGVIGLMCAIRAAIRCMVQLDLADQKQGADREKAIDTAHAYLKTAQDASRESAPRLIAVAGLSGTGKTTLARQLAPRLAPGPGAVHLRSDVERKIMCGHDELQRLPESCYRPEVSRRVYARLLDRARRVLASGWPVIVDAVFLREEERKAFETAADEAGVPFIGLWLTARPEILYQRVENRKHDASDATAAIVARQLAWLKETPGPRWHPIDASGSVKETLDQAEKALSSDHAGQ